MEKIAQLVLEWSWLIKLGGIVTALGILWKKILAPLIKNIKKAIKIINDLDAILLEDGRDNFKNKLLKIEHEMWLRRERHRLYMELDEVAVFETDNHGNYVWVSEAWVNLFGQNYVEASSYGWLAGVNSEYRDKVSHEWEIAQLQKRQFKMKFKIKENGKAILIICTALPIKDEHGTLFGYIGKIKKVEDDNRELDKLIK